MALNDTNNTNWVSQVYECLILEPMQTNVLRTTDEQPNWRRRAGLSLEEIASDPNISHICSAINLARKGH